MKIKLIMVVSHVRKRLVMTIMKTFILLFCTTVFALSPKSAFSQAKITIDKEKNVSVDEVFKIIKKQTKYIFLYPDDLFKNSHKVYLKKGEIELNKLLELSIPKNDFNFELSSDGTILIKRKIKNNVSATEKVKIKGVITNTKKELLIGATVWVKGTKDGAISDFDGSYEIMAKKGDVLVFDYMGYKKLEITITDNLVINPVLLEDVSKLNEVKVVSTGYQKISKERATGSYSVITAKDLEKIPVQNVMQQLEGQVAGLAIDVLDSDNSFVYGNLKGDGAGQSSYGIRIRGQSTYNANSLPLLVLDGAPTELDIRTLNPNDIESITFLKDAAAASIYGARSANGVMVVETKKGKRGKTRFSASQTYSIAKAGSLSGLPLMNSSQVLDLEQELVDKNIITDPAFATSLYNSTPISQGVEYMFQEKRGTITNAEKEAQLNILRGRNNYDQVTRYLMRPSESNAYNFSFSGGENDYTYFTSASFSNEKTQAIGTGGKRMTFTVNQDFKLLNYFKVSTSLKGSIFNYENNGLGISPLNGSLTTFLPYNEIVDANGNSVSYDRRFYSADNQRLEGLGYLPWKYNYIDELNNADKSIKEENYSANISVTAPLFKGLDAVGTYFVETSNSDGRNFYNENTFDTRDRINNYTSVNPLTNDLVYGIPLGGINQNSRYGKDNYTARGQLIYDTTIANKHEVNAVGGIEFRETKESNQNGTLYGYNEQAQTTIDLPSTVVTDIYGGTGNISYNNLLKSQTRRFLSYYGNASYSYDNKYTLSGSVRLDDYNNFGVDKSYRRTPLWSTGFKWNISKENFMAGVTFINNLSFRASYGYNGNISLTTFPFTSISLADIDRFSQDPYGFISAAANPALRWEKTGIMNFGLDFTMFDYRLNGTIEYYKKDSRDLIQEFPVSPFYGIPNSMLTRNASTLEGHGVDLTLNGQIIKGENFNLGLTLVTSYNTNEVTDSKFDNFTNILNGTGSAAPIVGYPTNSIFAFRNAGLNESGAVQVYDKDGNIVQPNVTLKNIEDMKYMGSSTPKYYGSLGANISYKKVSLYLLATYKLDYALFKPTFDSYVSRYGTFDRYSLNSDIDKRWRNPGDEATTIVPGVRGMTGYSYSRYRLGDNQMIDGDHIRFKEISIKYDLSNLFANTFISNASITCSARNVGIIWRKNNDNIDPDFLPYTGTYMKLPPMAMYALGVNLNF